jgi:hypothetical protein
MSKTAVLAGTNHHSKFNSRDTTLEGYRDPVLTAGVTGHERKSNTDYVGQHEYGEFLTASLVWVARWQRRCGMLALRES